MRSFQIGLLALIASGCSSSNNDNAGTLQQGWTIEGTTNPAACTQVSAAQMRLVILDQNNVVSATQFASCTDFTIAVSLPAATFSAAATFLNANGLAVSRTLVVPSFNVFVGQTTVQNINFTVSDFTGF
jgi:hypothetical protein